MSSSCWQQPPGAVVVHLDPPQSSLVMPLSQKYAVRSRQVRIRHFSRKLARGWGIRRYCSSDFGVSIPMMNKMVVANLVHRPTRSLITMSAIALEVTMILMVVACSTDC